MQSWQMQEAKARMSELLKMTQDQPQQITVHGKPVAVVMSVQQYEALANTQMSLTAFMRQSPLYQQDDIEFEREAGLSRDIDL